MSQSPSRQARRATAAHGISEETAAQIAQLTHRRHSIAIYAANIANDMKEGQPAMLQGPQGAVVALMPEDSQPMRAAVLTCLKQQLAEVENGLRNLGVAVTDTKIANDGGKARKRK